MGPLNLNRMESTLPALVVRLVGPQVHAHNAKFDSPDMRCAFVDGL